ncbi:hypothetical protein MPER_15163, partial [Moniliophthora perniciosa FA553]
MELSAPTNSAYKLVIAYAIPVYPAHWAVGVTELIITNHSPGAGDIPHGWVDERKVRYMREQWSQKVSRIADTHTDVELAHGGPPYTLLP